MECLAVFRKKCSRVSAFYGGALCPGFTGLLLPRRDGQAEGPKGGGGYQRNQWWNATKSIYSRTLLKYKFEVLSFYLSVSILRDFPLPHLYISEANILPMTPLHLNENFGYFFRLQFFMPFLSKNRISRFWNF